MNAVANVIWNNIFYVPDKKDSRKQIDIVYFLYT